MARYDDWQCQLTPMLNSLHTFMRLNPVGRQSHQRGGEPWNRSLVTNKFTTARKRCLPAASRLFRLMSRDRLKHIGGYFDPNTIDAYYIIYTYYGYHA